MPPGSTQLSSALPRHHRRRSKAIHNVLSHSTTDAGVAAPCADDKTGQERFLQGQPRGRNGKTHQNRRIHCHARESQNLCCPSFRSRFLRQCTSTCDERSPTRLTMGSQLTPFVTEIARAPLESLREAKGIWTANWKFTGAHYLQEWKKSNALEGQPQ